MKKSALDLTANQPRLKQITNLALNKKADKLIILDVRELSSLADFFIICHGNSEPQVKAIADNIRKGTNHKPRHIEGYDNQNWILLDYFDIIVHVFKKDDREYYNLERLWADAPYEEIDNERN
tara:strand:- start:149 stop:517 length:369 start_codon:yes stop_codon:yes gene_type:complete